jgi:hypothetical protein
LDGFGFRDELAGVTAVQLPSDALNPKDATVIGSDLDEIVFVWAGNNIIDLGGGNDLVIFYDSDYTDFDFNYDNDSVIVKNIKTGDRVDSIRRRNPSISKREPDRRKLTTNILLEFNMKQIYFQPQSAAF